MRPPSHAQGAMIATALIWDHFSPAGPAIMDPIAPAAISPARIAACVAGRLGAIRAVSHPATSANTQPQIMVAILKVSGAGR